MEPRDALVRLGGVARTCQLRRLGSSLEMILDAAFSGTIIRLRKGVYAVDPHSAVAQAAAHGGAVSCVSALAHHGVWVLEAPIGVHVDVGTNGRRHMHASCECVSHNVAGVTAFGVASPRHASMTAWRCLPLESYFAAFESAWRLGRLTRGDREHIIAGVPRHIARWLACARGDADSGLESIFRFRLLLLGIYLESQVHMDGVGRVDFRYGRLLFEIDGRQNHETAPDRHKDLRRDAAAIRAGNQTMRFTYGMIIHGWDERLATIKSAIAFAA